MYFVVGVKVNQGLFGGFDLTTTLPFSTTVHIDLYTLTDVCSKYMCMAMYSLVIRIILFYINYIILIDLLAESQEQEMGDDEDLMVEEETQTFKCPYTGKEMVDPVKNTTCGHSYAKEGIMIYIKQRGKRATYVHVFQLPLLVNLKAIHFLRS